MRAGFGKHELTPPMGVELAGYGYYLERRAQSVIDPLYARAVLIEQDGLRVLIISCDLLGLSRAVCGEVIAHAAFHGLKPEHVIIVSIHTHTGPCIKYHEGCGEVNDEYISTVASRICRAVDAAVADMDEVLSLSQTTVELEGDYIYNRAAENGPIDRMLRGFVLRRTEKSPVALVSAACHGVFRQRIPQVSADFAGEINRLMEEKGFASMYINGLCGDIDPYMPTPERLCAFAQAAASAFCARETPLPLTLQSGRIPFELRLMPVTEEDIRSAARQAVENAGGANQPAARVALVWEQEMLEKLHLLTDREAIEGKYVILGGVTMLALPFEGFTRIGMDVRKRIGRQDALILGCAEELLGYLPTKDDIARGAYAALESTFLYKRLPVIPGEAERLGEEMGEALHKILAGGNNA